MGASPGPSAPALDRPPAAAIRSAAAGVVAAARARVARAGALHHAAALLAGRAEVEPDEAGWDHRWGVRERDGRRLRGLRRAVAAAVARRQRDRAGRAARGAGEGVLGDLAR